MPVSTAGEPNTCDKLITKSYSVIISTRQEQINGRLLFEKFHLISICFTLWQQTLHVFISFKNWQYLSFYSPVNTYLSTICPLGDSHRKICKYLSTKALKSKA